MAQCKQALKASLLISVSPTLVAAEVAKREDVAVVSVFHSRMEREVLEILLKGRCGIICVLARPIYKVIPAKFQEAFEEGRITTWGLIYRDLA